jgi:hypothetical protein
MQNLYFSRYEKLINFAKNAKFNGYTETHHIIPKSLGGTDSDDNLIVLSSRLHFIAHWMLWKAYQTNELAYAFFAMCHQKKKGQHNRYTKINSKTYALLKQKRSNLISESNSNRWKDPIFAEKMSKKLKAIQQDPAVKEAKSIRMKKQNQDPAYRQMLNDRRKEKMLDPVYNQMIKQKAQKTAEKKRKTIQIDGKIYHRVSDVCEQFNISIPEVRRRIKSDKTTYSNWQYCTQPMM